MGHKQLDFESIPKYGQKSGFELKKLQPKQPFVPSFTIHQPNNHQTCGTVGFSSWDRIIITTTTTTSFFWSCSLHDLLASCSRIPSLIILSKYVFFRWILWCPQAFLHCMNLKERTITTPTTAPLQLASPQETDLMMRDFYDITDNSIRRKSSQTPN